MRSSSALVVVLAVTSLLAACGKSETPAPSADGAPTTASDDAAPADTGAAADAAAQATLASLPAPYNAADWANGKKQFARCRSCHTLGEGQADMTGPNLHGFLNRPMASKPGYNYSDALKEGEHHPWDATHLDAWIENPRAAHPGTKMAFAGLKDAEDRRDLIAYLMTETGYKPG
ncbi:MAG: cytochrome c family protein [Caulobacteraceae bacterium]|nr:cytochrome c family protein [Caulobacteraceae bacterium]